MPFAGYKDFDDCVKEHMRKHKGDKGFTLENARRMCGAIQARTEKKEMQEEFAGGVRNE